MDGIRIRQLALERRATYRARSYCVIASATCAVIVVQLVWMAIRHMRLLGVGMRPIGYLLFALLATLGCIFFLRRATELHREATTKPAMASQAPDFSTLDNGSERARRLEDVR